MTVSSPRWDPGKTTPPYWIIAQAISGKQLWWNNILNNLYTESRRDAYPPTHVCFFCSTWWRHQMKSFSALLILCSGNSPVAKGQWRGALMFSMICAWINGWVNNDETSDLGRRRAHYDVIVMTACFLCGTSRGVASDDKVRTTTTVVFQYTLHACYRCAINSD